MARKQFNDIEQLRKYLINKNRLLLLDCCDAEKKEYLMGINEEINQIQQEQRPPYSEPISFGDDDFEERYHTEEELFIKGERDAMFPEGEDDY